MTYRPFKVAHCKIKNWHLDLPNVPKDNDGTMTFWSVCCDVLAKMATLRELRIVFYVEKGSPERGPTKTLEAVKAVGVENMQEFSVQILGRLATGQRSRRMWKRVVNEGKEGTGWVEVLDDFEVVE